MLSKLKNYLSVIIVLVLAAALAVLLATDTLDVQELVTAVRDNKLTALLVIMALYVVKGCTMFFPVGALLIATSMVFDIHASILIGLVGSTVSVALSYLMGRSSKKLTFDSYLEKYPKFAKYFSNAQEYSFLFVFAVHTLHLSMEVQGVLFGLLRTPFFAYIAGSMLALFPSLMCYIVFGYSFDLSYPLLWVFLGLDVLTVIVGLTYAKRNIIDGGKKKTE